MSLLYFLARSLFVSAFVADGVRKVTSPAELTPEAEAFIARVTPPVQWIVPPGYFSYMLGQIESQVRIYGAVEIVGGMMFATGIGRRLEIYLLANANIPNITVALPKKGADAEEKQAWRPDIPKNVAPLDASVPTA